MANGDYGYFGKGDTGYAQYMTAFNRNFGGSSGGSFVRRCFSAAASPRQNSGCHSSRMPMSAQTIFPHSGAEFFAICKGL